MKKLILSLMVVVLASSMSCTGGDTFVAGMELKSDKTRGTSNASQADLETLVSGNTEFALDLYQQLSQENEDNLFYSPYSISLALAMTYAGARGETKQQMADVLHFTLDDESLHAAFNKLALELASRSEVPEDYYGEGFQLNIANALWGQKDYKFLSEFLDVLAENYDAGIRLVDFKKEFEEARIIINNWVSEQTEGRIEEVLPEGSINNQVRFVLTNAIYFSANWRFQFEEEDTYDDIFYLLDGSEVTVPMMHQTDYLGYAKGDGYQAVELPYDTGELSMVIILPEKGSFEEFENSLDTGLLDEIIGGIEKNTQVVLTMPRFEFESEFSLKEVLEAMDMTDAFYCDEADFSGITDGDTPWLDDVIHKAFVSVDEEGTEAAASSLVIGVSGISPEPPEVNIDHPFIFLIRDIETDTILFIGRVMNPS
jgi:serpin B